jgi:hypothetical protein
VRRTRNALAAATLLGVLAGCAGPAAAPAPPVPAPAPSAPAAPSSPGPSGDQAVCAAHSETADTVRNLVVPAMRSGPILPRAAAFLLLNSRNRAATPGVEDPALAAAQAELVAAIDDVDAQGRAGLPPGGDPGTTPVQLDPTRLVAAVEAVEKACAG